MTDILYCGDVNTRKGIALSILSLIAQASTPLKVHIMTMSREIESGDIHKFALEKAFAPSETRTVHSVEPIDEAFASYMDALVRKAIPGSSVQLIDATAEFEKALPEANIDTRFTPCCMLRLYADLVQPALPDRILYLDYDVLCRKDFTEFYNTPLDGYEYAACLDYYGKWFYSTPCGRYINSGVLLMNLACMRQTGFLAKCRELCRTKKLFLPDQHALNRCWTKRKIMPAIYNSQKKSSAQTVFRHFSTTLQFIPPRSISVKPWDRERMHSELNCHEYDSLLDRLDQIVSDLKL